MVCFFSSSVKEEIYEVLSNSNDDAINHAGERPVRLTCEWVCCYFTLGQVTIKPVYSVTVIDTWFVPALPSCRLFVYTMYIWFPKAHWRNHPLSVRRQHWSFRPIRTIITITMITIIIITDFTVINSSFPAHKAFLKSFLQLNWYS